MPNQPYAAPGLPLPHFKSLLVVAVLLLIAPSRMVPSLAAAPTEAERNAGVLADLHRWLATPPESRPPITREPFATKPLSKAQSVEARRLLLDDHTATIRATREKEWKDQAITLADHTLKWKQRHFGTKPKDGWNLYISLHGGGNAAPAVNDEQWENQIKLYQPVDALYVAPRAPTDTWNLWHEPHMDVLLARFLEDAFVLGEVNPDRVYIMGYSAGGDGVYQLAPRMADRFAAAAMMAGHPNDASPLGLRNIGFTIHVGALDAGYNRNKVAAEWGQKLDHLKQADPDGYAHVVQLHAGRGHWMNLEDKVAVDWMAGFTRDALPSKVMWQQSAVTHDRLYWLSVPPGTAAARQILIATRNKQAIDINKADGVATVVVLLNDRMVDLDRPITISANEKVLFNGKTVRTIASLAVTLADDGDPALLFDAAITVSLKP